MAPLQSNWLFLTLRKTALLMQVSSPSILTSEGLHTNTHVCSKQLRQYKMSFPQMSVYLTRIFFLTTLLIYVEKT